MEAHRIIRTIAPIVNLLLLTAIAYFLAQTINTCLADGPEKEIGPAPANPIRARAARQEHRPPLGAIESRDLFGSEPATAAEPENANSKDVPQSRLRLELVGVYYLGPDHPLNIASLRNPSPRAERLFLKGSQVTGDAVVAAIEWDRVILERSNGDREELRLHSNDSGAMAEPTISRPSRPRTNLSLDPNRIVQDRPFHWVIPRELWDEALEPQNLMGKLVGQIRLTPREVTTGGKEINDGFQISGIRSGSLFERLGLQRGDVLLSVNGEKLDGLAAAASWLPRLGDTDRFSLAVERQGQVLDLVYEVR